MSDNYNINEPNPLCPYCDAEQTNDEGEFCHELWKEDEYECHECGKKFRCVAEIVYTSHGCCELNGEEHKLEETHIPNFYTCTECEYCEKR